MPGVNYPELHQPVDCGQPSNSAHGLALGAPRNYTVIMSSCLVDVIELYAHGVKRPRDEVRASAPVRAQLSIDRMLSDQGLDRPHVHAHLVPFRLEPLYRCRVEYLRGRNIVLSGQQLAEVPGRKRATARYEQWWWCRIVTDPSPPVSGRS